MWRASLRKLQGPAKGGCSLPVSSIPSQIAGWSVGTCCPSWRLTYSAAESAPRWRRWQTLTSWHVGSASGQNLHTAMSKQYILLFTFFAFLIENAHTFFWGKQWFEMTNVVKINWINNQMVYLLCYLILKLLPKVEWYILLVQIRRSHFTLYLV